MDILRNLYPLYERSERKNFESLVLKKKERKRKGRKNGERNHHNEKNHNPRVLITHVQYDLRSLSRRGGGLRESKSDRKVRDWLGRNLRTLDSEGGPKIGTETCSAENLLIVIGVYTHTRIRIRRSAAVLDRAHVCAYGWGTHLPRNFSSRDVSPSFHSASK